MASAPTANDVLAEVARRWEVNRQAAYSGLRHYSIRNQRFSKSATATVLITSEPVHGKQFTMSAHSGSSTLVKIISDILSSEAEASRPGKAAHEVGPSNYKATMRGSEVVDGLDCWVLELTPKAKSKYLLNGKAWVDKNSFGIVRLEGTTSASVSIWVGTPHIVLEFAPVEGVWLPLHTASTARSFLLGETSVDIRYIDYQVRSVETAAR
jgi:hypothetical protein